MWISQTYARPSSAQSSESETAFSLSAQEGRAPVKLKARIKNSPDYARAMLALFEVVQGDERFHAKDHTAYQEWVRAQYLLELAPELERQKAALPGLLERKTALQEQIGALQKEAKPYHAKLHNTLLWDAKRNYWKWLYSRHRELWILLDPVVSVHPDAVIFEVFSQDESSYGRVSVDFENLETEGETSFGTTNVDFSDALADEIRRVRSYRPASLEVGAGGVSISTDAGDRIEKKIDLPESWVRGFLQVQSAGTFPGVDLTLSASTVAESLAVLKRQREKQSPRALKFVLENGKKPRLVLEPWNIEIAEHEHVFEGESQEIRVWGRRRLGCLEAILEHAETVQVRLLGTGMPHFWSVSANGHRFDVGLSGWTKNDWSSAARFDLLASTASVSPGDVELARDQLEKSLRLSPEELAARSDLSREAATSALQQICREGDAMFDSIGGFYRWRKLLPPGVEALKPKPDPKVETAKRIVAAGGVTWKEAGEDDSDFGLREGSTRVLAKVSAVGRDGSTRNQEKFDVTVDVDADGRATFALCTCAAFRRDKLKKGPCSHILATVALASARVTGLKAQKAAGAKASFNPEQFAGLSFCFTGKLSVYGREQAENLVQARGGKAASGVSKDLSYLVVGEKAGSKLVKAKLLGVKVISEAEFQEMIG